MLTNHRLHHTGTVTRQHADRPPGSVDMSRLCRHVCTGSGCSPLSSWTVAWSALTCSTVPLTTVPGRALALLALRGSLRFAEGSVTGTCASNLPPATPTHLITPKVTHAVLRFAGDSITGACASNLPPATSAVRLSLWHRQRSWHTLTGRYCVRRKIMHLCCLREGL